MILVGNARIDDAENGRTKGAGGSDVAWRGGSVVCHGGAGACLGNAADEGAAERLAPCNDLPSPAAASSESIRILHERLRV